MPRISLYRPEKSNDYKFFDKTIAEMLTVGGTDMYVHKYLGPKDQGSTQSKSQPQYDKLDPTNIQDLLFLENRDRKYDDNIYRLRGHYNVQNLDFDLSQFGLFLNNDVIFITIHYNTMIELIGRKLMVGDVFELPHLTDYHPLNEKIPTSLRRYYQITDANFASEGFSSSWYPHLWRVKCEPLVDSQEFSNILEKPMSLDNFLGDWDKTSTYVPGYVVNYGGKNYTPTQNVPAGIPCTDTTYWQLDTADNLKDIISRYNKNIEINQAMMNEAARLLPSAGYDRTQLYLVPTNSDGEPLAPKSAIIRTGSPEYGLSTLESINGNPALRVGAGALKGINELLGETNLLKEFVKLSIEIARLDPVVEEGGSRSLEPELVLKVKALGPISTPYGTVDNINSDATINVELPTFNTDTFQITEVQDFRADADPRFKFIQHSTPQAFGYTSGYMAGDASAPNGEPFGTGIQFPSSPKLGEYFLRLDYLPQQMFRWDGNLWVKISEVTRTSTDSNNSATQMGSFINNTNVTQTLNGPIPEQQPLSSILGIQPD
jgi:hypothetical protein